MPNITKEELSSEKIALSIELSQEESNPFLEKASKVLATEKPPKGFRPGKVDFEAAKKFFGEMAIYEAALDLVIRGTLPEAVEDSGIEFVGQPDVSVIKCAPGNPISYKAIFLLAPKVTLADYKKIKIERKEVIIDETRVNKLLDEVRESRATEAKVERVVKDGDHIVADVRLSLDSVPLDGGSMLGQHFLVGKQELWEGFGKEVEGMELNKKKEFTLTISKEHSQKNIAGKNIEFDVKVKELFERTLPELNDDFAKALGSFESLDALKEQLKKNLVLESANKEQERIENELLSKLVEQSGFSPIPEAMIEREKESVLAETKQMIQQRGMDWQAYLDHLKKNEEELRQGYGDVSGRRIKNNLVLVALAKQKSTDATEEEIEKEFQAYLQYNPEATKEPEGITRIKAHIATMLSHRKALAEAVDELAGKLPAKE